MSSTKEQIFYDLDQTPERIDFAPCKKIEYKNGYSNIKSECKKETYIRMPRTGIYGFSLCHDSKIPEKERTIANANGLQICVNLTSKETVNPEDRTPEEKRTYKIVDALWAGAIRAVQGEFDNLEEGEKPKATPASWMAYRAIRKDVKKDPSQWTQLIKPLHAKPNKKDTKIKDLDAPDRMYIKLLTVGGGEKPLNVKTNIFDEDDNSINALSYIGEAGIGEIEWVFRVEGLYWGAHGTDNPWQVSVTLRVTDVTFYPSTFGKPPPRMLPSGSKTKAAKKTAAIEYPDVDESDFDTGAAVSKKKASFDTPTSDGDSDSESKPKKKGKTPVAEDEDSDSESKSVKKKGKAPVKDDEGDSDSDNKPAPKKTKKVIKKKATPPPADDEDEDSKPAPKKTKKIVKKVAKKKKVDSDDEE